jgi:tetratricopeptide (TPR) repeat protein
LALKEFLEDHADFEPVYIKLLERYLYFDKIEEAKEYFQKLTAKFHYRDNGYWMLAKIFVLQNAPSAAFDAYTQALLADTPSFALLNDFAEFTYQQPSKFDGFAALRTLGISPENQKVFAAFVSHKKKEHENASKLILEFPQQDLHSMLILQIWGDCYYELWQDSKADSIWNLGLAIARQEKDLQFEAQFLVNLGLLARAARKYDQSLSYYDSAYAIANRIDDLYFRQLITANRGSINYIRGDYSDAAAKYHQAIELASRIRAYGSLAKWFAGYAQVFFELGEYLKTLQALDKGEEFAQEANDKAWLIEIKLRKAAFYYYLKQHDLAKKTYQEVYDLAYDLNLTVDQRTAEVKLAEFLEEEGKYQEAREAYQEYINFLNPQSDFRVKAYWFGKIAGTYEAQENYDLAKTFYERAVKFASKAGSKAYSAWYLLELADIGAKTGRMTEAIQMYETVRATATEEENMSMLSKVYLGLGNAYKKAGDLSGAISSYHRAAGIIEKTRKNIEIDQLRIGYFSEGYEVYRNLAHCYLQRWETNENRPDLDSLFYFEAMSRGRALQDLKLGKVSLIDSNLSGQHEEYQEACKQLRSLQRRIRREAERLKVSDSLIVQLEALRYTVVTQRLRMYKADTSSKKNQPYQLDKLSAFLQDLQYADLGLLLYHISEEVSFVLVASGHESSHRSVTGKSGLDYLNNRFFNSSVSSG